MTKTKEIVILIIIVALAAILWWGQKPKPEAVSEVSENEFSVRGYYEQRSRIWYEDISYKNKEYVCDSFYISSGGDAVVDYFKRMVMRGNGINELSPRGELVINLDLSALNTSDVDKIKSSNLLNNTTLRLKKLKQDAKEAPPCYSFFEILAVE